jgi:chemotaxis signal transduction protein
VDSVAKVITVPASKISPPPDIIVPGCRAHISRVVHLDESILIVDFKKILSIDEKQALDGVTG